MLRGTYPIFCVGMIDEKVDHLLYKADKVDPKHSVVRLQYAVR